MTTLIENECVRGKEGTKSWVPKLIDIQENLTVDLEEMKVTLAKKDAKISYIKEKVWQFLS